MTLHSQTKRRYILKVNLCPLSQVAWGHFSSNGHFLLLDAFCLRSVFENEYQIKLFEIELKAKMGKGEESRIWILKIEFRARRWTGGIRTYAVIGTIIDKSDFQEGISFFGKLKLPNDFGTLWESSFQSFSNTGSQLLKLSTERFYGTTNGQLSSSVLPWTKSRLLRLSSRQCQPESKVRISACELPFLCHPMRSCNAL